ncbi:MAG: hypothetical protein IPM12_08420 [Flavobacteriales bacterium]|nr:hypothetical protein [Flavobacteriales bacterium]
MVQVFALSRMGHIGLLLLTISGVYLIWSLLSVIWEMPLLIAKLVLLLVLGALIGIISAKAHKAQEGDTEAQLKAIAPLGRPSLLTTLTIVILAVLVFH